MEEQVEKVTIKQVSMKWGVILALISFVYFIILNMAGVAGESMYSWLGIIFTVVVFIMAHKSFKEEGNGFMSFGEGFKIGALISIISALISNVLTYVYIKFVDDSMMSFIREKAISDMEEQGMSDAQIDQAMGFAEMFMSAEAIMLTGIFGGIIGGLIVALIVSAFTKNQDPAMEV